MKYSKQREMIFRAVQNMKTHPTADNIYTALKAENPTISLGTVYRNLNMLSECGKILKIKISDGSDRFDFRIDPHYHMICEDCGGIFDVEIPELENLQSRLMTDEGLKITSLNLTLGGVCPDCLAKREAGKPEEITEEQMA